MITPLPAPLLTVALRFRYRPNRGGFLLQAHDGAGRPIPPDRLMKLLYTHDPATFFGTFLPKGLTVEDGKLWISGREAIRLMCNAFHNRAYEWSSDPSFHDLQETAQILDRALREGALYPNPGQWRRGTLAFRLGEEGPTPPLKYSESWLNLAIRESAASDAELQAQLERQESRLKTLLDVPGAAWDDTTWLQKMGFEIDRRPYRFGLELQEPYPGDERWRLFAVLVERETLRPVARYLPDEKHWHFSESVPWEDQELPDGADEVCHLQTLLPLLQETQGVLTDQEAWTFLDQESPQLEAQGYVLMLPSWWEKVLRAKPKLEAKVSSKPNRDALVGLDAMVSFDWRVALGDTELSQTEFESLADRQRGLLRVRDQWMVWDPTWFRRIRTLMAKTDPNRGLTLHDVLERALLEGQPVPESDDDGEETEDFSVSLDSTWSRWVKQLNRREPIPEIPLPEDLQGTLRPYQQQGVAWLWFLRRFGLGAILADDMGLGKTLQYIAYLLICRTLEPGAGPSLLIVPTSVLGNWERELNQFAPDLNSYIHYGTDRLQEEDFASRVAQQDVVITTYAVALADAPLLATRRWNSICLDEAQQIKNAYSKRATALRKIPGRHRIAMTGTPIENRLGDLWSIMSFVNPGYLGGLSTFNRRFAAPIEKSHDETRTKALRQLIAPFILRRVKSDPVVALNLPEKTETKVYVTLTREQATLYEAVVQRMLDTIDTVPAIQRRGIIVATLTRLKQICDHPALALAPSNKETPPARGSAKLVRLSEMVQEVRAEGDQALIFTQFVGAGHLIRRHLSEILGEPVGFLHGSLNQRARESLIQEFRQPNAGPTVLVLSLKAGGVGLNLTEASHVFHFDRWWNPAVENQATDRAHRIGQTEHVQVHKFIALGTVEERIDVMLEQKSRVTEDVVGNGEDWVTELSTPDLRELMALRRTWLQD